MCKSMLSSLVSQWFDEYVRLAYWLARKWCQRLLDAKARNYSATDLEELAQDAVARGFDRFVKRCERNVCGQSDRKKWICQCVRRGAQDAVKQKSRFGSVSDPCAVRDDVLNRCLRVTHGYVHGNDNEKQDALEQIHYVPLPHAVQRWELEELIQRELPFHLQQTALYAACGLTQEQSAILQGVTDRQIRNRLQEIREYLDPCPNIYAVICSAIEACLTQPRKQDGQALLPFLLDALQS